VKPKRGELVIYLDESGSPDVISTTGEDLLALGRTPRYFVIAAIRCPDPNVVARCIQACIAWADACQDRKRPSGPVTFLHAAKDDPIVREHVYNELAALPIKATAIAIDKTKLDPGRTWRNDRVAFYNELAGRLLSDSLHLYDTTRLVFSHKNFETGADLVRLVEVVRQQWLEYVRKVAPTMPASVTARQDLARTTFGLQAVDYIAWAIFRALEVGDLRYYEKVKPIVRHVHDIGALKHYTPRDPIQNPPRLASP
jgi:hypothetical protein